MEQNDRRKLEILRDPVERLAEEMSLDADLAVRGCSECVLQLFYDAHLCNRISQYSSRYTKFSVSRDVALSCSSTTYHADRQ